MKKYLIGIIILIVVLALIILDLNFDEVYCTKVYIDINSGDIREQNFLMFFKLTDTVKKTNFSEMAKDLNVIQSASVPEWKMEGLSNTLLYHKCIYTKWTGSPTVCERLVRMLKAKEVSKLKQKELISQAMIYLKNGEIDEIMKMASRIN
ncbi:MAG: hypothetical protein ABR969_00340 [Sedimentisphaerales bacterium]|jgi:hypothetical protein